MINNSYLLALYGQPTSAATWAPTAAAVAARKQPTAPWSSAAEAPAPNALVRSALAGRRILNEASASVDLKGASPDYRKLFALYQAVDTLAALADRAMQQRVPAAEMSLLQKRFSSGVREISEWLPTAGFDRLNMVQGVSSSSEQTTAAVPKGSPVYVTPPVHQGELGASVAAFEGDVRFGIQIETMNGTKVVDVDLAELGAAPRTLGAVLLHINDQLAAAGVQTRIGRTAVNGEPRTLTLGGKSITLPARAEQWALTIQGNPVEKVSFSAPQRSDAVYVVQSAGASGLHEVLKFQSDGGDAAPAPARPGETWWVDGRAGQSALPDAVDTVRASAAASDGGIWIVADLATGMDDQPIKGQRDVALLKLDAAGQVVTTRLLGAASTASGFALSVGPDGKVAVAGSVTGALDDGKAGADAMVADSFVTVFDAEGEELWTQRRGARAADEATAVAFGADGVVHVAGRAQSAISGGTALGGWDGYVQSFSQSQAHALAPVTAAVAGVAQFGSARDDSVGAIVAEGNSLFSAGIEDGRLVVRRFDIDTAGRPTLAAQRDLGPAGGEVGGLSIVDGKVLLSGVTTNSALGIDTVTTPHNGGTDAYVAVLATDLVASADDRLTYLGGAADDSVADMKVLGGKVWITGVADRPVGAAAEDPSRAYLARLDPLTGAVEWRRDWQVADQRTAPLALAAVAGGASVLDRLGLPQGALPQAAPAQLTAATALRAGDRFQISPVGGGRATTVTISADETLESLARKIERASNRQLKVTLKTERAKVGDETGVHVDVQRLMIVPRDGRSGAILTSGESGRDALAGLGISPGHIGPARSDQLPRTYGLDLPNTLDLGDPKAAKERLERAMLTLRSAYRALAPASTRPAATGPAPAYLTAQLANYQAALARLGG